MTTAAPAPREIYRALGRVAARLRAVGALKGAGTVAVVASIGAALGMAADFAWILPTAVRWWIWGGWLALSGAVALAVVARPLVRPLAAIDLAALAERGQPEFAERLVGSVALLAEGEGTRGSHALIDALAGQAAGEARTVDPRCAVPAGRAARRLAVGLAVAAVVVAPALVRPDPFGLLARRFLAPWLDLDRVGAFVVRVSPGDAVVAVGSDLEIVARVSPRLGLGGTPPDAAWLEWDEVGSGRTDRLRMATQPPGEPGTRGFAATLPRLAGSIRYRVTTAPAASRRHTVEAVEPPALAAFAARVEPPSYTRIPAGPAADPSRLDVIEGSAITFSFRATRPVASVEVHWPSFAASGEARRTLDVTPAPGGGAATLRVVAEAAGSYPYATRLRRDAYGLDGPPEPRRLIVRPDRPPTLAARPVAAAEAGAADVLTVPVVARDDFAVATAGLHYEIRRGGGDSVEPETGSVDIPLDGLGTPRASGEAALGLKAIGARPGDALSYRVRVADNRPAPLGPNVAWSEPGSLTIVAKAEPLLARRDRLRRERVRERIEEIKKENLINRHETTGLRYAADAAQRSPSAWDKDRERSLADREGSARKVVDGLNALAHDLEADPDFRALAGPAKEIADVEAEAGRAALDEARRAADPSARLARLRGADARLGAVHHRVEELQRRFDDLAKLDGDRQRLRALAAREDALASQAARAGDDQEALAAVRAEQEAVRAALDELAKRSPELKAGLLEAQAAEATDLAAKARDLAARQRDEARKTAEGSKRDDALKALADDQRAIERDARRLALDVDEPLAENGRSRLNARALQDAVPPIERGEVAPGRQRLEEAEAELRRLARDLEDAPADPRALARRLARRQDDLSRRVAEAVREAKRKDSLDPKPKATLAEATRPLIREQEAILGLAAAIRVDEPRKGPARDAIRAVGRALENLKEARPRESAARQDEAKAALVRLAEALPDPWRRDEPARQAFEEARRLSDEAARDLDRHLRETAPQPGKPADPASSAVELARRLEPAARKAAEAIARLAAIDAPARSEPRRGRAVRRAADLVASIEALRAEAAPLAGLAEPRPAPIRDWQVVGPFAKDDRPPIPLDGPVKPSAKFPGKGGEVTWKPAKATDGHGKVDLGALYSKDENQSAFAVAEVDAPEGGVARFAVGSDDTVAVWVGGKPVHKFDGSRAYAPGQDTFTVVLPKGTSRVVVRCGNGSGEWAFGVEVAPPPAAAPAGLARAEAIRRALPQASAEARAALERFGRALHGQETADETAEELAAEASDLAKGVATPEVASDPAARRGAADDQRRLAAALRSLPVPDAPALRDEAVRLADAASRVLDDPKAAADAAPAVARAAGAAKALADRLADRLSPRAEAAALASAERGLEGLDLATQARRQRPIAAQAARLEAGVARSGPNDGPGTATDPGGRPATASEAAARAADLADRAAQAPSNDPARSSPTAAGLDAARAEAAAKLDAIAARAPESPAVAEAAPRERPLPDAPRDPELDPLRDRAAEARGLARRERRVRERLQAVLGERVAPQEALRREAAGLGRELAGLRDRSREPGPRGRGPADVAADLAAHQAPRAMDQGLDELAQGRPDAARDAQRRAAEHLERAGQAAEDLARSLKLDRPADAAPADLRPAREALAEARRRLADEGREPGLGQGQAEGTNPPGAPPASPGPAAAGAMQRAARAMRTAARAPGGAGEAGPAGADPSVASGGPSTDPRSSPAGVAPADLSELQAMVRQKTGRAWGELPGHLRTEILQLSQGKYRDDYARLIGLYFREIAADAARPEKP